MANYFEEQVSQVLESLNQDPEGMYQIVYRVGELMMSAHVWREPSFPELEEEFSERTVSSCANAMSAPTGNRPSGLIKRH